MARVQKSRHRARERAEKLKVSVKSDTSNLTKADTMILTEAEKKLLAVLVKEENYLLNVTKICKLAGISRDSYYRIYQNDKFIALLRKQTLEILKHSEEAITHSFIKQAKAGSFPHQRVYLEMMRFYTPKAKFEGAITMMDIGTLIKKLRKDPEGITEEERSLLEQASGVVNDDGSFSLHLLLIEYMRKAEAGEETDDWKYLLLTKPVRLIVEKAEHEDAKEEIYKHIPGLKEQEEKEDRERKERRTELGQKLDRERERRRERGKKD